MTIANPASSHTEANVDEADIAHVAIGQKARVYAIAYRDVPVEGVVDSIAVSAKVAEGQQGQSFAIKIRLLEPGKITLRPGHDLSRREGAGRRRSVRRHLPGDRVGARGR